MRSLAALALALFALVMDVDWPPAPVPAHAEWGDAVMLVAALLAGAMLAASPRRALDLVRRHALPVALALAYAAWGALSALHAGAGGWKALGLGELAAVATVTALVVDGDARLRDRLARAWIATAAAEATLGLVGIALGIAGHATRLLGTGGDLALTLRPRGLAAESNLLAELCLVPLVLLVADGARLAGRWARPLVALLALAVVAAVSRTLLAAVLGVTLVRVRDRRVHLAVAAALLVAAVASVRLDVRWSVQRFGVTHAATQQPGHLVVGLDEGIHWRILRAAARTVARAPLWGVGPASLPAEARWPDAHGERVPWDAHDTPLDVAGTTGLPSLLFFAALFAVALRRGLDGRDATARALAVAAVATAFDSLTIALEDERHVWLLLGLLVATTSRSAPASPTRPGATIET